MTRLLLRDARYVHHGADGKPEIRRGHIATDGSRIAAITESLNGTDFADFEPVDMSDRLVTPA